LKHLNTLAQQICNW